MDETSKTNQDAPQAIGQPSGGEAGTTPSNPRTYTEADVQKLISDIKAEAGRRLKTLETEAQAFKTQAENLEAARTKELEELAAYRRQKLIDETAAKFGLKRFVILAHNRKRVPLY